MRVRFSVLVLALLALAALASCGGKGPDWRIVQLYGGRGSVSALTDPTRVEAYRIGPIPVGVEPGVDRLGIHPIVRGPIAVPDELVAELSAALISPDTYDWALAKICEFRPGVGLRFTREVSRVDIALCFECDMLTIHRHGKRIGSQNFDDARATFVNAVKRLFPDDEDIQALE